MVGQRLNENKSRPLIKIQLIVVSVEVDFMGRMMVNLVKLNFLQLTNSSLSEHIIKCKQVH